MDNGVINRGVGAEPSFGLRPPTPEEYRRMWEEQSRLMKPAEYERVSKENKDKARRQVFQEAVQKAVSIKDSRLVGIFNNSINIMEKPKKKTRRKR